MMVRFTGVPPIGLTRVAVIAETEDGVRMAYMLDTTKPVHIEIDQDYDSMGRVRDSRIVVAGEYQGMNIWEGPMPGHPVAIEKGYWHGAPTARTE